MVAGESVRLSFRVDADAARDRQRLDHFLAAKHEELTRSQVRRLIDAGEVTVNGEVAKASRKLRESDLVEVVVPPPTPTAAEPESIPLVVLFEDEHLIVIDKAAGMVVHPAPGHHGGTLVNALLAHCKDLSGIGGELRPGIVHRIDKDTSGVMVATKSDAAHQAMTEQFQNKEPFREYVAVVAPPPKGEGGTFDTLHGRHPVHRKRFSSKVTRGKRAVTHYSVVERYAGVAAQVSCRLETGRTHQIRVHFADAGMALIGDPMYGGRRRGIVAELGQELGRQALHAARLAFAHPVTGEQLAFESALPADMLALIARLRAQ